MFINLTTYWPTYLHACQPAYGWGKTDWWSHGLYLPTFLPTILPTCLPTYVPTTIYQLTLSHQYILNYHLPTYFSTIEIQEEPLAPVGRDTRKGKQEYLESVPALSERGKHLKLHNLSSDYLYISTTYPPTHLSTILINQPTCPHISAEKKGESEDPTGTDTTKEKHEHPETVLEFRDKG